MYSCVERTSAYCLFERKIVAKKGNVNLLFFLRFFFLFCCKISAFLLWLNQIRLNHSLIEWLRKIFGLEITKVNWINYLKAKCLLLLFLLLMILDAFFLWVYLWNDETIVSLSSLLFCLFFIFFLFDSLTAMPSSSFA